jgi:hypothetical protein
MKTPPPLPPELEALLAPHRTVLPLAPPVEARALARAAAATAAESTRQRRSLQFGRPWWVFAAAASAVLALGAGAYAARGWIGVPSSQKPAHAPPHHAPRATDPAPPAVVASTRATDVPPTVAPEAPRKRVSRKTNTHAVTVPPTNEELQLLRSARQDVTRGAFARALEVIAEHARRFRHGSLVEEREALRVKSLAGLGRHEEAQRAAAAFRARFPHSVFLSTFDRMKETDR